MARFDELRTPRLLLRRWRDADRAPFAAMNADPEVMRFFPQPMGRVATDAWVDQLEERFETQGFGLWALQRLVEGDFIGFTGLNPLPPGTPGAGEMEIGWRLTRFAWGRGYASEAARVGLRVGLVEAGLPAIWSLTAVLNEPSQAVMRRIGLIEHSRFDHPRVPDGHPLQPHVAFRTENARGGGYRLVATGGGAATGSG